MSFIELRNVSKVYGKNKILNNISLSMDKGEFLVLVGPSGCGKSTLLNLVAGLDDVSSGEIYIDKVLVNELNPWERDIAMVFQSYALYPNLDVSENIAFGLRNKGFAKDYINTKVSKAAKQLQIEHLMKRKPAELSGGQRQRVAMGRAISRDPKVYLFDEPLSNLDAKLRLDLRMELKLMHQETKNTAIYVTHDQTEAMTLGDRIALLDRGEIQQLDRPLALYERPRNLFVAGFIGTPTMNFLHTTLKKHSSGKLYFDCTNEQGVAHPIFVYDSHQASLMPYEGKELVVGLRSEHFAWQKSKDGVPDWLEAEVTMNETTGADTFVSIRINKTLVHIRSDSVAPLGEKVLLNIRTDKINYFDPTSTLRIG